MPSPKTFSKDYMVAQGPDQDVGRQKAPAEVNLSRAGPQIFPVQGRVVASSFIFLSLLTLIVFSNLNQLFRLHEQWEKWVLGASQVHLVRCMDPTKLLNVLVLETQENIIYTDDFLIFYGIQSYNGALSYRRARAGGPDSLSILFVPHNFGVW